MEVPIFEFIVSTYVYIHRLITIDIVSCIHLSIHQNLQCLIQYVSGHRMCMPRPCKAMRNLQSVNFIHHMNSYGLVSVYLTSSACCVTVSFSMENDLTWVPEKDMGQAFRVTVVTAVVSQLQQCREMTRSVARSWEWSGPWSSPRSQRLHHP